MSCVVHIGSEIKPDLIKAVCEIYKFDRGVDRRKIGSKSRIGLGRTLTVCRVDGYY